MKEVIVTREGENGKKDIREAYTGNGLIYTPLFYDDEPRFYCKEDNIKKVEDKPLGVRRP